MPQNPIAPTEFLYNLYRDLQKQLGAKQSTPSPSFSKIPSEIVEHLWNLYKPQFYEYFSQQLTEALILCPTKEKHKSFKEVVGKSAFWGFLYDCHCFQESEWLPLLNRLIDAMALEEFDENLEEASRKNKYNNGHCENFLNFLAKRIQSLKLKVTFKENEKQEIYLKVTQGEICSPLLTVNQKKGYLRGEAIDQLWRLFGNDQFNILHIDEFQSVFAKLFKNRFDKILEKYPPQINAKNECFDLTIQCFNRFIQNSHSTQKTYYGYMIKMFRTVCDRHFKIYMPRVRVFQPGNLEAFHSHFREILEKLAQGNQQNGEDELGRIKILWSEIFHQSKIKNTSSAQATSIEGLIDSCWKSIANSLDFIFWEEWKSLESFKETVKKQMGEVFYTHFGKALWKIGRYQSKMEIHYFEDEEQENCKVNEFDFSSSTGVGALIHTTPETLIRHDHQKTFLDQYMIPFFKSLLNQLHHNEQFLLKMKCSYKEGESTKTKIADFNGDKRKSYNDILRIVGDNRIAYPLFFEKYDFNPRKFTPLISYRKAHNQKQSIYITNYYFRNILEKNFDIPVPKQEIILEKSRVKRKGKGARINHKDAEAWVERLIMEMEKKFIFKFPDFQSSLRNLFILLDHRGWDESIN